MRSIVHDMGAADAFLSLECLSHVQRLYLCGKVVYLQVPARVSWQRFSITGSAPSLVTVLGMPQVLVRLRSTPGMACSPDGGPQVINEL